MMLKQNALSFSRLMVFLGICIVVLLVVYPFVWLILSSFKFETDIVKYPPGTWPSTFTFEQYVRVWHKLPLLRMFVNTVIFSGSVTLANCFLCAMAGYAFARIDFRGKEVLFILILVSMMIPFQIYMIPLYIEEHKLGILNTFAGLILPRITWPFAIYMMRSFFVSIPKSLEEAARIDGAGEYRIFGAIMLPLCRPAFLSIGIMTLVNNWNDLAYPLILTNTAEMRTLSAGLALFVGQRVIEYGATLAAATISLFPLLLAYILLQKYFVKGVVMSGLKG